MPVSDRITGQSPVSSPAVSRQMATVTLLSVERLYRPADLTTSEIEPIDGLVGQQRAFDAIGFGTRVPKPGFNLFVIGSSEARMQEAVENVLRHVAQEKPRPPNWVYVN